ncbi:MAG: cytochrome c3 family protein [Syntrophomonadaceae bacterium]
MEKKSFRERFLNRKTILILVGVCIIIGAGTGVGLLKASENPSFCGTCHLVRPYYQSWHEGALLDNKHAQEDVRCQDCHIRSIPEKAMEGINFITGNYTLPLEGGTEIDRRFCLECHSPEGEGSSWDEIRVATNYEESNPHDSHHGEQECNICHNMHEKSYAFCSDCHIFDWLADLDEEAWDKAW